MLADTQFPGESIEIPLAKILSKIRLQGDFYSWRCHMRSRI